MIAARFVSSKRPMTKIAMTFFLLKLFSSSLLKYSDLVFQLHPMYDVAVAVQDALSSGWIVEIKSFKTPPPSAVEVILCLCEMFKISPASWENGKALISREK